MGLVPDHCNKVSGNRFAGEGAHLYTQWRLRKWNKYLHLVWTELHLVLNNKRSVLKCSFWSDSEIDTKRIC